MRRKLSPWQVSYLKRAISIRRRLTNVALAQKFGVCKQTLKNYQKGVHKRRPAPQHSGDSHG